MVCVQLSIITIMWNRPRNPMVGTFHRTWWQSYCTRSDKDTRFDYLPVPTWSPSKSKNLLAGSLVPYLPPSFVLITLLLVVGQPGC